MKIRKISALLLALVLLLGLAAGCGGGGNTEPEDDGKGDVIAQEPSPAPTPQDSGPSEPEVNAEDFYGCWEYSDTDVWVCIYGDGSYEIYNSDGIVDEGGYYMDGDALCLNSGISFVQDPGGEAGWIMDSNDDSLFASELPGFSGSGGYDDSPTVTAEDFYGCWEYADSFTWVYIYGDGTYEWYGSDGLDHAGGYYMFGDELCLEDGGMSFSLDGYGGLVDAFGDELYRSELPEGW